MRRIIAFGGQSSPNDIRCIYLGDFMPCHKKSVSGRRASSAELIVMYVNSFRVRIIIWVFNGSAAKRVAVDHEVYITVVPKLVIEHLNIVIG